MDPLRWQRIGELFAAASLLDVERRVAFLKENCGQDQDLFDQVKSLLDIDDQQGMLDSKPTVSTLGIPKIVAGRFRIIRYIAEGGMGTVYEAEDLQLHDPVALKTIRPDIASNPQAVERFKQEIRLGKRVTHPNVCRIHDLGTDRSENGTEFLFLTMQFLGGETLASCIRRGPVPQREALPLIEDMADALSAAHQADVIHRDFKSGNVILVPGAQRTCAVVTDFGLARGISDGASLTRSGLVGTVGYMAPEQILGGEITPATDIYAFGVVMYEMVTGQLPFTGDSKGSVLKKHLNDEPPPPRDLAPHLDPNWNEAILGCLRKQPCDRFQSAAEVKAAVGQDSVRPRRRITSRQRVKPVLVTVVLLLLAVAPGLYFYQRWTALPKEKHIAVLPFENIGNDAANEAFNDGVVETLTSKLSQLERYQKSLWVVPSSDARQARTLDDAYRKLNATLAVTGSIQHTEKGVILTANLVDAKNHRQLSSRTIHADSVDLDVLQDRVWESVADMIDLEVDPEIVQNIAMGGTKQPQAYELYTRGMGYLKYYDKVDQAIDLFTKALAKDSQYGDAYAGLGDAYATKYFLTKDSQWIEKAAENVRHAIELKDTRAPVYVALGKIYQRTGRLDEALAEFRHALDEDPASLEAQYYMGDVYEAQGKTNEAEAAYRAVIIRWPWYWLGYSGLGTLYYNHGRFAEAAQQFREMVDLAPDNPLGYYDLGAAYLAVGKYDDAIAILKKGLRLKETAAASAAWSNLGGAYMYLGKMEEAIDAMKRATDIDPQNHVLWRNLADSYNQVPSRAVDAQKAYARALQEAEAQVKVNPKNVEAISGIALYDAHLGRKTEAAAFMKEALSLSPKDSDVLFTSALVYEIIGDRSRALTALDQAVKAGYSLEEVEKEPELRALRSDQRYQHWLRRKKLAEPAAPLAA